MQSQSTPRKVDVEHARHTAQTAHADDRVQYLVVGDESSLAELQAGLSLLPLCARGRVFVEVPTDAEVGTIEVPLRMTVTWLTRANRSGRPGTAEPCARGAALTRAVKAWSAEMLCDGPGATHAELSGDYRGVSEIYDHLVHVVGMSPVAITVPAAFKLNA
jgi:NADPH-dependent ferric siderophore reductase